MKLERINPILTKKTDEILIKGKGYWGNEYSMFDGNKSSNAISIKKDEENYIGYNFKKYVSLEKYVIHPWYYGPDSGQVNCPTDWILQGSNDDVKWIDIQKINGLSKNWEGNSYKEFNINKDCHFKMFRLYNIRAYGAPGIFQLEFLGSFVNNKYLIKQNQNYHSIKSNLHPLGEPVDNTELKTWFDKHGTDDINTLFQNLSNKETPMTKNEATSIWKTDFELDANDITGNIELVDTDENNKSIKYDCNNYRILDLLQNKFHIMMLKEK